MTTYIGGDQNPLRQGFLRAVVIASKVAKADDDSVHYFLQDADAICGGSEKDVWTLGAASKTYFPFSFDMFGHPEYPIHPEETILPLDATVVAKLRTFVDHPRLIIKGPDLTLTMAGVSSDNGQLWKTILSGFERELMWASGLTNRPQSDHRAQELWQIIWDHQGSLYYLIVKLGLFLIQELEAVKIESLVGYYSQHPPLVEKENCWVFEEGHRTRFKEEKSNRGILIPRGTSLIKDLCQRGYRFYATHLPYENSGYDKVTFKVQLPVNWGKVMGESVGNSWKRWSERPTLLALYIIGGKDLITETLQSARVESR